MMYKTQVTSLKPPNLCPASRRGILFVATADYARQGSAPFTVENGILLLPLIHSLIVLTSDPPSVISSSRMQVCILRAWLIDPLVHIFKRVLKRAFQKCGQKVRARCNPALRKVGSKVSNQLGRTAQRFGEIERYNGFFLLPCGRYQGDSCRSRGTAILPNLCQIESTQMQSIRQSHAHGSFCALELSRVCARRFRVSMLSPMPPSCLFFNISSCGWCCGMTSRAYPFTSEQSR